MKETIMGMTADRKFDLIAALSVCAGAVVVVAAAGALAVNLAAVAIGLF